MGRQQSNANGTQTTGSQSGKSILAASARSTSVPDINGILWWIGWNPLWVISPFLLISLAVGYEYEILEYLVPIGLVVGLGIWYWGTREINGKYESLRNAFYARSASRAEDRLALDPAEVIETFNFRSHGGNSPPLVAASRYYRTDHMILSDVSVSVDKGSRYNMEDRDAKSTGTTKNIYYDNIETIRTNDEGSHTSLKIITSQGEDLRVVTVDQSVAESAQGTLRSKMRDVRRAR